MSALDDIMSMREAFPHTREEELAREAGAWTLAMNHAVCESLVNEGEDRRARLVQVAALALAAIETYDAVHGDRVA